MTAMETTARETLTLEAAEMRETLCMNGNLVTGDPLMLDAYALVRYVRGEVGPDEIGGSVAELSDLACVAGYSSPDDRLRFVLDAMRVCHRPQPMPEE